MSGTLPFQPGATPPDPRLKSLWGFWLGVSSVVLGFVLPLPLIGLVLSILGFRSEPEGRRAAKIGIVLNGASLILWSLFAAPLLGLIGFF